MGKIVVGSSQLFLTDTANILKASELTKSSMLFCFNGDNFIKIPITSINKKQSILNKYTSSHGRILKTSPDTKIVKKYGHSTVDLQNVYTGYFREIVNEIRGVVCSNFPIFGVRSLSKDYVNYLTKSLVYKQKIRPHRGLIKQTIPRYLSKMNSSSLTKVLSILFKDKYFKHMDEGSKDLLILLCSRLGLSVNGTTLGHKATKQSGSLKVDDKKQDVIRKECIIPMGNIEEQAYEIETESETLLVGSILCQI